MDRFLKRWIVFLNSAGIHATHWSSVGATNASDTDIMAFAKASTHGEKPSVVQIRSVDISPEKIGKQVALALLQMQTELERGALITIDPVRLRMRLLPLLKRHESES